MYRFTFRFFVIFCFNTLQYCSHPLFPSFFPLVSNNYAFPASVFFKIMFMYILTVQTHTFWGGRKRNWYKKFTVYILKGNRILFTGFRCAVSVTMDKKHVFVYVYFYTKFQLPYGVVFFFFPSRSDGVAGKNILGWCRLWSYETCWFIRTDFSRNFSEIFCQYNLKSLKWLKNNRRCG